MSMSHTPSFLRMPTADRIKAEHIILLIDATNNSTAATERGRPVEESRNNSEAQSFPPTPSTESGGLYHRWTNNSANLQQSVRREIAKQKYARYGQDRYNLEDTQCGIPTPEDGLRQARPTDDPNTKSYLERAQARARATLRRRKGLGRGKDEEDTIVDVLYENQRGVFFFGIPKYSSSSLLPSDPKPWQNGQFRTSPVDIRNAQVPDPSWQWAWKSWYVDMSQDVDEEGWEYSFAFVGRGGATFAWHGSHPWFNSFVRRRRWLRMRKRRDLVHRTRERAHELTADYFTIHPTTIRPSSLIGSQNRSSTLIRALKKVEEPEDADKAEVTNVADLFLALRKAPVDRERLAAVRRFTNDGGDELIYLSERMDDIMGMLMFQNSRRQLLSDLISRHEEAHQDHKELATHEHEDDEEKQMAHAQASRHADFLLRAVHAADEHVKRLEYWSDMKDLSAAAVGIEREEGHDQPSFRTKQGAEDGTPDLHKHPEHPPAESNSDSIRKMPRQDSNVWYDAIPQQPSPSVEERPGDDGDRDLERFTTAAESASEIKSNIRQHGKGKAKASDLDGVQEE